MLGATSGNTCIAYARAAREVWGILAAVVISLGEGQELTRGLMVPCCPVADSSRRALRLFYDEYTRSIDFAALES